MQPGPKGHRDRVRHPGSAAGTPPKQGPPGGAPGPRPPPRGTPHAPPRPAVLGSVRGRSRNRLAGLLRVSAQAGLTGSRAAAPASSWHALSWGTRSRPSGARSGSGQRASGTRARSGTGPGGDGPRSHGRPGARVERHGTSTWLARPRGPRRRPSSPQPSWCRVQRPPRPSHALTVGHGLGADVVSACPSGSRSPRRWSSSPWPSSRRFGSLGTRMSSYHYLLETLPERKRDKLN